VLGKGVSVCSLLIVHFLSVAFHPAPGLFLVNTDVAACVSQFKHSFRDYI
jgi:hypothetical protein